MLLPQILTFFQKTCNKVILLLNKRPTYKNMAVSKLLLIILSQVIKFLNLKLGKIDINIHKP